MYNFSDGFLHFDSTVMSNSVLTLLNSCQFLMDNTRNDFVSIHLSQLPLFEEHAASLEASDTKMDKKEARNV